jgi:adenylyltransferase/sulfurtransferase
MSKLDSAISTLKGLNPNVKLIKHDTMLTSENALEIMKDYDIIIDGTDNFPTRYLVNDACVLLGKPNVYGSIFGFEGQLTIFYAKDGPCYRCLYPEPPPPGLVPSCAEAGVLGVLPGVIGCLQAVEAIKLIIGQGELMTGRLLLFNALTMRFKELKLRKDAACPVCGEHPTIDQLIDYEQFCGLKRGTENVEETEKLMVEISALDLKSKMDSGEQFTLIDVREPHEYAVARIPGSILVPLGSVAQRLTEFDRSDTIVLHCKSGKRSAQALEIMREGGFKNLANLKGGILAWSRDVDPSVPVY